MKTFLIASLALVATSFSTYASDCKKGEMKGEDGKCVVVDTSGDEKKADEKAAE